MIHQAAPGGADIVNKVIPGGPGPGTQVSNNGGGPMYTVQLHIVFWGDAWNSPSPGSPTMADVYNDIAAIVASPYLDGLREYGPTGGISVVDAWHVGGYNPTSSFTSTDTNYIAWYMMAFGPIPQAVETVVCVMMPPGVTNSSLNGEHSTSLVPNLTNVPVLWVLYRDRAGISCTFSHELVETITDPDGSGVQIEPRDASNWNEIGDACNNICTTIKGVTVQAYWSNVVKACIVPVDVPTVARQITCIRKHNHADAFHPIRWVGGVDIPSKQSFQLTQLEVIQAIDAGNRFFVQGDDGTTADVKVFLHFPPWSPRGVRYIATVADASRRDNLLSLPECPRDGLDRQFPYG